MRRQRRRERPARGQGAMRRRWLIGIRFGLVQGTRFQGNIQLSTGAVTSFNMTLIARGLSNPALARSLTGPTPAAAVEASAPTVTGNFETGKGLIGTVQGTLTGSLDQGFFDGSLTTTVGGRVDEQQFSGPITTNN